MFDKDLIGRLALKQKRRDDFVNIAELFFRHVHTGTGGRELLVIFTVSKAAVIMVLMGHSTVGMALVAAITDIRCLGKAGALFLYKIGAVLVAGRAGCTFDAA